MVRFNVRRIAYALGAEITGVDLSKSLDGETVDAIRRTWLEHLLLCFPIKISIATKCSRLRIVSERLKFWDALSLLRAARSADVVRRRPRQRGGRREAETGLYRRPVLAYRRVVHHPSDLGRVLALQGDPEGRRRHHVRQHVYGLRNAVTQDARDRRRARRNPRRPAPAPAGFTRRQTGSAAARADTDRAADRAHPSRNAAPNAVSRSARHARPSDRRHDGRREWTAVGLSQRTRGPL